MKLYTICFKCEGKGSILGRFLFIPFRRNCPVCRGTGKTESQLSKKV